MTGTFGDTRTGGRWTVVGRGPELVPQQRRTGEWADRPGVRHQPMPMVILLADPLRDSRERLASGLVSGGAGRVIQADSVDAVDDLIADGQGGQLALVSLGFGDEAPRLIGGLRRVPWTRVIALALSAAPEPLMDALTAGASGVLRGHPGGGDATMPTGSGRLTPRELEVLGLVAEGCSNKWIAERLSLSALTVKSHLSRISRKLGTGDRSHQVAIAMRAGVLR